MNATPDRMHHQYPVVNILSVAIHNVTMAEAVEYIDTRVAARSACHVVTVNPEFIMTARKHEEFRRVLNNAALAVPDGVGVVLAGRLQGSRFAERVAGVDLVNAIARRAGERAYSIFFLGAKDGVADRAAAVLQAQYPGMRVAGTFSGSPRKEDEEEILRRIRAAAPDILLVAYGSPQQDLWISRNQSRAGVPVALGIGGTFDFITGESKRAPGWVRSIGMEWLHRLIREPYRWKRMLALPHFALRVILSGHSS